MVIRNPIRGSVAKIVSPHELVINRGSSEGVKEGMKFGVLDLKGENIVDPETGKKLGSLERTKVEVEVTQVHEHLSLAQTFKTTRKNVGGSGLFGSTSLNDALSPPKWVDEQESFRTDESEEELSESDSLVKTGDPVKQISHPPGKIVPGGGP